jgi:hypothetical protein
MTPRANASVIILRIVLSAGTRSASLSIIVRTGRIQESIERPDLTHIGLPQRRKTPSPVNDRIHMTVWLHVHKAATRMLS